MSRRERTLMIVSAVVIVFLVFFYYVYSPKQALYRQLGEQLTQKKEEVTRMEAMAQQTAKLERDFAQLQAFIASVEAKLPTSKEVPALLVQLERLTKSLGIDLTAIKPSALEAGEGPALAPAPGQPPAPPGGQRPPSAAGTPQYLRFPIKLTLTASYEEMLKLMSSLYDFPRLIVVRRIAVSPKTLPALGADLDVETVVLPKEAR